MGLSVRIRKCVKEFSLDASLEIGDELAVLFGPSGAGKSLTLRMISGLMRPDDGRIRSSHRLFFDGERGIDLPAQKRSLGYVFQDMALFPHMTVRENVLAGCCGIAKGEREERTRSLMDRFRIAGLEDRRPPEISGGQKQRVALARSLARRPEALLLDEPFSALDSPLRAEMRTLLSEIQCEFRIPVVVVTHDLDEACELADQLIVYANGSVVQAGTPHAVLSRPATPEISRLFRSASPATDRCSLCAQGGQPHDVALTFSAAGINTAWPGIEQMHISASLMKDSEDVMLRDSGR